MTQRVEIKIDESIRRAWPETRLGCITFSAEVGEPDQRFWAYMDDHAIPEAKRVMAETDLAKIPGIACSREAYKAFGRNPTRYRVSSESLLRRIRQDAALYRINTVVDVNNLLSIDCALSCGSYDLGQVRGAIRLALGGEGDGYMGIGKEYIDMKNMPLLWDDDGPFGSPTSDSRRALITLDSRDIILVVYCFSNEMDLDEILRKGEAWLAEYAGAKECERYII